MPEDTRDSKAGWWIAAGVAVIIIIGAFLYLRGAYTDDGADNEPIVPSPEEESTLPPLAPEPGAGETTNPSTGTPPPTAPPTTPPTPPTSGAVKSFTVEGSSFAFSVPEIRVNKGDKVKITFVNKNGFHDWRLDEFNAKTPQVQAGQSATVEFTADKAGTFEYYCSVGNHRQMGMKGNLIVQ